MFHLLSPLSDAGVFSFLMFRVWGHISMRVPDEEDAYLTVPWPALWTQVTASNLIKVTTDGQVCSVPVYSITLHSLSFSAGVVHRIDEGRQ